MIPFFPLTKKTFSYFYIFHFPFLFLLCLGIHSCKTLVLEQVPETIDLHEIQVVANPKSPSENILEVKLDSSGTPFVLFYVSYKNSGIHLIEKIKSGEILDAKIKIFNDRGELLSEDTIHFQEFGDDEMVPQVLSIPRSKLPKLGSFLSIYIEILLVDPNLRELVDQDLYDRDCLNPSAPTYPCNTIQNRVFSKVSKENREELKRVQTLQDANQKEVSESMEYRPIATREENGINKQREFMKREVEKINSRNSSFPYLSTAAPTKMDGGRTELRWTPFFLKPFFDQSTTYDGNRLYYREWKLVSAPKFFQILGKQIKKEEPRAIRTLKIIPTPEKNPKQVKEEISEIPNVENSQVEKKSGKPQSPPTITEMEYPSSSPVDQTPKVYPKEQNIQKVFDHPEKQIPTN